MLIGGNFFRKIFVIVWLSMLPNSNAAWRSRLCFVLVVFNRTFFWNSLRILIRQSAIGLKFHDYKGKKWPFFWRGHYYDMVKLIFVDLKISSVTVYYLSYPWKLKDPIFLQLIITRKKHVFVNYSQKRVFAEANLGN